jgi:hypothetical protein
MIDSSDDAFDPKAAKSELLAKWSPNGAILDEAQRYFLAVDITKPLSPDSYRYPFCKIAAANVVAAKTGWRESFAALENSDMPATVIADARSLTQRLEQRLGEAKSAVLRRQAEARAIKAKVLIESLPDLPKTREERLAEARALRRSIDGMFR